jgi:flagellar biosynthesis/type III secretory pathway protein FliH
MQLQDREQRIREVAYRIWEEAGRPSGQDNSHWRMACHTYELSLMRQQRLEAGMRSLDDIIAGAQEAVARALREAFDEGRAHTASELKNRMAALFEDLITGHVGAQQGSTPHTPSNNGQTSNHEQNRS